MDKTRQKCLLAAFHDNPDRLIHAAFRYYLGRMPIATCCFADDLAKAWPHLDKNVASMIRRELEEAFEQDDKQRSSGEPDRMYCHNTLGQDCDRAAWALVRVAAQEGTE